MSFEEIPVVGDPAQLDVIEITEYDRGRIQALSDYHQELFDSLRVATAIEDFARNRIIKEIGALAQRLGVDPARYDWHPQAQRFVRKHDGTPSDGTQE